jgi:hypothetical protein
MKRSHPRARPEPSRRPLIAGFLSEFALVPVAPGVFVPGTRAQRGRAAYYRAEATRIDSLASDAPADQGREHFAKVAEEYRHLADTLDARIGDDDDDDDFHGDGLDGLGAPRLS